MEMTDVTAKNVNVLAEVLVFPDVDADGIYKGSARQSTKMDIEYYYGQVINHGDQAGNADNCPEISVGKGIVFSDFAGYHVKTDSNFCKVIAGSCIVATFDNMENVKETLAPTKDRILVEIIGEELVDEDGIYNDNLSDPRQSDTQKGRVISCAEGADQYPVGTIVAFDPYTGNMIFNEPGTKLKTISSFDILCTISE